MCQRVVRGSLVIVDESGTLSFLDALAGHVAASARLGMPVAQAIFNVPSDLARPSGGAEPVQSVAQLLGTAASAIGDDLLPARMLATRFLSEQTSAAATQALVALVSSPTCPDELRTLGTEALAARPDGARAMIETLATHYDYYRRTPAARVGFIARALGGSHDHRAVAPLLAHLRDPYTPLDELDDIAAALQELGDHAALAGLLEFLTVYHADDGPVPALDGTPAVDERSPADRAALRDALAAAAMAVGVLGGPAERERLHALQRDPTTIVELRSAITVALAPRHAPSHAPAGAHGAATASVAPPTAPPPLASPMPTLPPRLTPAMIDHTFAAIQDRLARCVSSLNPPPPVTVHFRYDGEGRVLNVIVQPAHLQGCFETAVRTVTFPRTRVFREVRTFVFRPETARVHHSQGRAPARR